MESGWTNMVLSRQWSATQREKGGGSLACSDFHDIPWSKKTNCKRISIICYPACKKEGDIRHYTPLCSSVQEKYWEDISEAEESGWEGAGQKGAGTRDEAGAPPCWACSWVALSLRTIVTFHVPKQWVWNLNQKACQGEGTQMEHKQQQTNRTVLQKSNIATEGQNHPE